MVPRRVSLCLMPLCAFFAFAYQANSHLLKSNRLRRENPMLFQNLPDAEHKEGHFWFRLLLFKTSTE
jgi:hypothetical protein